MFLFQVIFFAIVHAEKLGHYGRVLKLSQNLVESSSSGSSAGNGKVRNTSKVPSQDQPKIIIIVCDTALDPRFIIMLCFLEWSVVGGFRQNDDSYVRKAELGTRISICKIVSPYTISFWRF